MLVIPAIDIYDGKCVRLRQGDYAQQTVYAESPKAVAQQFADAGLRFLHIVDLEGAKEKRIVNIESIRQILTVPGIEIEVGGGIRTTEDIENLLNLGVKRVVIGSVAVKSPELAQYWLQKFSGEKIIIGIDVKNDSVAISGWIEDSKREPVQFMFDLIQRGATSFICTDISRDGMLAGVNDDFYRRLTSAFPTTTIIASGGISSASDVRQLNKTNVAGVIIGKAIYENRVSLNELAKFSQ
jgi:phosphoribosylformimino-5-aminoimidazole carboxamide ribotide isomerase